MPEAPIPRAAAPAPAPVLDDPDEELIALPAPPRGQRLTAMTLMAAVVGLALAMMLQLRGDLVYFFGSDRAVDIGEATGADLAALETNDYVRVRGTPMLSGLIRFQRPLLGEFVVFPLAGQRQIFVQLPSERLDDPVLSARGQYNGRLMTFGELGPRYRAVRSYLQETMGMPVTTESFVVLAEQPPKSYGWTFALFALCIGIIAVNVWLMLRWFRPLPPELEP